MKTNLSNLCWTKIAALSCGLILVVGGTAAYAGGHGGGGHSGGSHSMGSHSMGSGQSSFRSSSLGHMGSNSMSSKLSSNKLSSSLGGSQFKKPSGLGQSGLGSSSARSGLGTSKNSGINGSNLKGKNTGIAGGLNSGKNSGKSGGLSSNKNTGIHGKVGQVSSHNHHGDHNGHKGNHDGHGKHHGDHNGHGKHHDHDYCHNNPHCKPCPSNHYCPHYCPGSYWWFPIGCWNYGGSYVNVVDVEQVVEVPVETVVTDAEIDLQLKNIELLDAGNPQAGQGPVYRITILNASDVAIETGFDVGLVVTNGQEPGPKSPFASERVEGIDAGELLFVEIQLPEVVNRMAKSQAGELLPFSTLFVAVDARQEITELEEGNNSAKVARTAVPVAAIEDVSSNY